MNTQQLRNSPPRHTRHRESFESLCRVCLGGESFSCSALGGRHNRCRTGFCLTGQHAFIRDML